jgi:predicted RNA polymerase sigma factor
MPEPHVLMTGLVVGESPRWHEARLCRAVAVLVRYFGDIDVAEEAVQDAFEAAIAVAGNAAERRFLGRRRDALAG